MVNGIEGTDKGREYIELVTRNSKNLQQVARNIQKLKTLSPDDKLRLSGAHVIDSKVKSVLEGSANNHTTDGTTNYTILYNDDKFFNTNFRSTLLTHQINLNTENEAKDEFEKRFNEKIDQLSQAINTSVVSARTVLLDKGIDYIYELNYLPKTLRETEGLLKLSAGRVLNKHNQVEAVEAKRDLNYIKGLQGQISESGLYDSSTERATGLIEYRDNVVARQSALLTEKDIADARLDRVTHVRGIRKESLDHAMTNNPSYLERRNQQEVNLNRWLNKGTPDKNPDEIDAEEDFRQRLKASRSKGEEHSKS